MKRGVHYEHCLWNPCELGRQKALHGFFYKCVDPQACYTFTIPSLLITPSSPEVPTWVQPCVTLLSCNLQFKCQSKLYTVGFVFPQEGAYKSSCLGRPVSFMHFANSVCLILHAPGFNWCCQKATKAMHLMSLGKKATGYGFYLIRSLFWHDLKMGVVAICLELTGWNRQACPPPF